MMKLFVSGHMSSLIHNLGRKKESSNYYSNNNISDLHNKLLMKIFDTPENEVSGF